MGRGARRRIPRTAGVTTGKSPKKRGRAPLTNQL
jgi:hypothetical protein